MWQHTFKIKSVLWTVCFLCLIYVKTTLSCYPKKNIQQNMLDVWFWHMWSTVSFYICLSSSCYTVHSRSTLLFIAGPSEPPRLIFIIAYILSDPSPPFQLAASRGREKVSGPNYEKGGPHLFSFGNEAASVSSCEVLWSSSWLLRSFFCSCQSSSLMLLPRGREQRERAAQLRVPSHGLFQTSSCKELTEKMTLLWHILVCASLLIPDSGDRCKCFKKRSRIQLPSNANTI